MKLFENGVGRPSNETLRKRKIFYLALILSVVVAITFVGVILSGIDISNLTGEAKKVDVSNNIIYKAGTKIKLSKVKVYSTSKIKFSLIKKTGIFYISNGEVKNGRIRITNKQKYVGNNKKIVGWINVNDIDNPLKSGTIVYLDSAKIYKTSKTTKQNSIKSGKFYIYSPTISNGRIRISSTKNSRQYIGWVNLIDIKSKPQNKEEIKISYQEYKQGTELYLNEKNGVYNRLLGAKSDKKDTKKVYIVVGDSGSAAPEVKVKNYEGKIVSISKKSIAAAFNSTSKKYYHTIAEALKLAKSNDKVIGYFSDFDEEMIVNRGVNLTLNGAWAFNRIVNNGTISFSTDLWSNEDISGEGTFIFNGNGAYLDLAGEKAIISTGLKFKFVSNTSSLANLENRKIVVIRKKSARKDAINVVDKIISASLNNRYTVNYEICDNETCSMDGTIILVEKK